MKREKWWMIIKNVVKEMNDEKKKKLVCFIK